MASNSIHAVFLVLCFWKGVFTPPVKALSVGYHLPVTQPRSKKVIPPFGLGQNRRYGGSSYTYSFITIPISRYYEVSTLMLYT